MLTKQAALPNISPGQGGEGSRARKEGEKEQGLKEGEKERGLRHLLSCSRPKFDPGTTQSPISIFHTCKTSKYRLNHTENRKSEPLPQKFEMCLFR